MEYPSNPYITGLPILGEKGFFGRQDILRQVQSELRNSGTSSILLFGQRRIGKTTLLRQLERLLPMSAFLPLFFNLEDQARRPLGKVLADLSEVIIETVMERTSEVGEKSIKWPSIPQDDSSGNIFRRDFLPVLFNIIGDRRPVFLVDEFDVLDVNVEGLDSEAAAYTLFPFFTQLMSKYHRLVFVFASGRNPDDLKEIYSRSTLKASLAIPVLELDRGSAQSLVLQAQENGTLSFTEAAVERVLTLTGCHPYLTQLHCQRIWELAYRDNPNEKPIVDVLNVEAAIESTLSAGRTALEWLWDGLTPAEKVYASALAEIPYEGGPIHDDRVREVLSAYEARLSTYQVEAFAPRDLVRRGILVEVERGTQQYYFANELLRRWISTRRPLEEVEEELDRIDSVAYHQVEAGITLLKRRKFEEARHAFEQALDQDPSHLGAHLRLGETLIEVGHLQDATQVLEKAYNLSPKDALSLLVKALVLYGQELYQNGDFQAALISCDRALALVPRYQSARDLRNIIWNRIGDEAFENGNWADASHAYMEAGNEEKQQIAYRTQKEAETRIEVKTFGKIINKVEVTSLSFSPDGLFLVSGCETSEVVIWGAGTGTLMRTLMAHSNRVNCVTFLPQSSVMASASSDHSIVLWDVSIGKAMQTLKGHEAAVNSVAFSPDGKYLASASDDQTIILWNTDTGEQVQRLKGHEAAVNSVAFSPDGTYLASGSSDHKIILWDAITGDEIRKLSGHSDVVTSVAFSSNMPFLASGSYDAQVIIWNTISGKELQIPGENLDPILSLAFSVGGNLLASSNHQGTIRLWELTALQ